MSLKYDLKTEAQAWSPPYCLYWWFRLNNLLKEQGEEGEEDGS